MSIYCEVCEGNIKRSNWRKHLKTTKHGITSGNIVVEEVEKKQCGKCRGHKVLEMFSGENATCNVCPAHRKAWSKNNPEKNRELSRKYGENIRRKKKAYNQEYNQREVECEACRCRVKTCNCNWLRHVGTRKHRDGVENGRVGEIWMMMLMGQGGEVELCPKATHYTILYNTRIVFFGAFGKTKALEFRSVW